MTEVKWDQFSEKIFEAGVDRGVLYPIASAGVAWNGLISVAEKTSGDNPEAYYFDGQKYINIPSATEFEATLAAFMYPEEFEQSDGLGTTADGVGIDNQPNKEFGLSYRTLVGNDAEGLELAYKINLIYNALASPSDKTRTTLDSSPEAMALTWDLTTRPAPTPGFKPSAHLILDTRKLSGTSMKLFEDLLYGSVFPPRLPLPTEVIAISKMHIVYIIANPDPSLLPKSAGAGDLVFSQSDEMVYGINPPDMADVRSVYVVDNSYYLTHLPESSMLASDLVYNSSTGILYKLGA